jgi:hypothetical protein
MTGRETAATDPNPVWARLAGGAGLACLLVAIVLSTHTSRADLRTVLGRYSTDYAASVAVIALLGLWWVGAALRPRSGWGKGASASFRLACEIGLMAAFVFGMAEGMCRLAERPLARFTGGPALLKDYPKATLNSRGMRDVEHALAKPAGTRRLLVLGDSFVFAQGVADESTCVRHLQRAFDARGGSPVEVIGAGLVGLNTVNEHALLDTLGVRYEPDLVLLSYVLNDPEEHYLTYPHLLPGSLGNLLDWSAFYYVCRAIAFRVEVATGRQPTYEKYLHALYDPSLPEWTHHRDALRGIVADARAVGAPVVVAIWPYAQGGHRFTPYAFERERGMAVAAAREAGAEVLDLYSTFERDGYENFAVSNADSHPNARAQRMTAAAIMEFLGSRGLLPELPETAAAAGRSRE